MSIQLKPMTNISENTDILEQQISSDEDVCCSCGIIHSFPEALRRDFRVADVGIIVCRSGSFTFTCEGAEYVVRSGETLFLSHGVRFSVTSKSADCSVVVIFYRADSIRNILGSTVVGMKFVEYINPRPCWVMHTGHENELTYYSQLLAAHTPSENIFAANERQLLLLSLTYRVCSIFRELSSDGSNQSSRKLETYMQLMQLIDTNYMHERGVRFYADRMCLSPKYLTQLVKSVSGSTVQQLVFKAITKKAVYLITSTDKSIKEISDYLNFPNASAFGTFFKKQVGVSPINYREQFAQSRKQ